MAKAIHSLEEYKAVQAYELEEAEFIDETDSFVMRLRHRKTGARILLLSNDNPYKNFHITFVTPIEDSTGVAHILEHSILSGSRKYPKGTFEYLSENLSIGNTNARTRGDQTDYFFSAMLDKEFDQLMDFYLDSVFYPQILQDEMIFLREGYRYEIQEEKDPALRVNGVVYNEMKSKESDYDYNRDIYFRKKLMSGSGYGQNNGGKISQIIKGDYEELKEYYHKYYHASNAYIYLYGDFDVEEKLEFLDREYLSKMERKEEVRIPSIPCEKRFRTYQKKMKVEHEECKNIYCYGYLFPGKARPEQALVMKIFGDTIEELIENEMYQRELDGYSNFYFVQNVVQDYIMVEIHNALEGIAKEIRKCIEVVFKESFDCENYRPGLFATMNQYELRFWEQMQKKSSIGEFLYQQIDKYWCYDERYVFDAFQIKDNLQYIKNRIWGNCYKNLVLGSIPPAGKRILVEVHPELVEEGYFYQKEMFRLKKMQERFTVKELECIQQKMKAFYEREDEGDFVEKKEVNKDFLEMKYEEPLKYTKHQVKGSRIYHVLEKQGKVAWLCFSFNANEYREYISELRLFISWLKRRNIGEFFGMTGDEAAKFLSGGVDIDLVVNRDFSNLENPCHVQIDISTSVLEENILDTIALIEMILFNNLVAQKDFLSYVTHLLSGYRNAICDNPDEYHEIVAGAMVDERMAMINAMDGVGYCKFLERLIEEGEEGLERFFKNCYVFINQIFTNENLEVYCNSAERGLVLVKKALTEKSLKKQRKKLQSILAERYQSYIYHAESKEEKKEYKRWRRFYHDYHDLMVPFGRDYPIEKMERCNYGIIMPTSINYIAFYGSVKKDFDYKMHMGVMTLVKTILVDGYLRKELREKGGAYGCEVDYYSSGKICITSYRDSHIKRTMEVINNCGEFLRNCKISEQELNELKNGYLTGYIQDTENSPWGTQEDIRCIEVKGMEPDFDSVRIEQIRNCTLEDIHNAADFLDELLSNGVFCVMGSRADIKKNANLFGRIQEL